MSEKKRRKRPKQKKLGPKDYAAYIQSDAWKRKRIVRLKEDGFSCQLCGAKTNLNVHHLTYKHLGCERPDELMTLCRNCHAKVHEYMKWEAQMAENKRAKL